MSSVNKVIIVGNLGADPEVRTFQSGGKIANLRIATSEHWTDRASGERRERTEWHSVVIRAEGLVGVAERFLKKGAKIYVEGQLQTRKWQDQAGADRYSTEIVLSGPRAVMVMLDGASGGGRGAAAQGHAAEESARWGGSSGQGGGGAGDGRAFNDGFEDDEIPF